MEKFNFLPSLETKIQQQQKWLQTIMLLFFVVLLAALVLSIWTIENNIEWEKILQRRLGLKENAVLTLQQKIKTWQHIKAQAEINQTHLKLLLQFLQVLTKNISPKMKIKKMNLGETLWAVEGYVLDSAIVHALVAALHTAFPKTPWQIETLSQITTHSSGLVFSISAKAP